MSFIDRLESEREENRLRKAAADIIKKLAYELTLRSTEPGDGKFADLILMRIDKAGKAYDHALASFQNDDLEKSYEYAERGLLHLELADYHASSGGPARGELLIEITGAARENIKRLSDALTEFKLLVEYRNLEVSVQAREKLEQSAQSLQDAIECLAFGDLEKASSTAEVGLVWLSFTAGQVVNDPSEFPRSLLVAPTSKKEASSREFGKIMELARTSGLTLAQSLSDGIERGQKARESLSGYLDNALSAFVDTNTRDLSRFLDLLSLESDLLQKTLAKRPQLQNGIQKTVQAHNYLTTGREALSRVAKAHKNASTTGGANNTDNTTDRDVLSRIMEGQSGRSSTTSGTDSQSALDESDTPISPASAEYPPQVADTDAPVTTSLKAVLKEIRRLCRKYCQDVKPVERVISTIASEVKALDYAIEGEKVQQATYRIANIKAARRELKNLLVEADLI